MAEETSAEKIARLEREIEALKKENARLQRLLEEALRAGKRQAAPFSRKNPKAAPEKPGRKAGKKYGRRCRRPVPDQVDEIIEVPLPSRCPRCRGELEEGETVSQFQTDIPEPQVERIEFRIHVGRCRRCRRRVQGRHPRQTSDAVGVAASQLGPRAVALATQLNKGLGLPYGKTAAVLQQAFGLRVSRGGLCQALTRVAQKAEPTYEALIETVRRSPSVTPDETGWKVGGRLWWMWAFSTSQVTVFSIQPGRGFEQAAKVLGADFAGFLVRDGWSIYRQFVQALHQSCLSHLLRRCREMIWVAGKGEAQFPRTVQTILQQSLRLRDRHAQGQISGHGVAVSRGKLETRLDRTLQRHYRSPRNRRLANHLLREREALFTFLSCPGLEATNWRAEQAIRPMVVTRKVWGGNRTSRGAHTQGILVSILQTCRQQRRSASAILQKLICATQPKPLDLTVSTR
ncbi:MAG: IS66 family transposase [Candidatus Acidiferrales bacterium]